MKPANTHEALLADTEPKTSKASTYNSSLLLEGSSLQKTVDMHAPPFHRAELT